MATVTKWTPFGVALDITATGGTVTRISATQFTVKINASWETYYSGAQTKYGMVASSGGSSVTLKTFSNTAADNGSGSFTGTYSISGNGSATKTITVTFRNFNDDNGDSATKSVSFNVTVPAWTSYKVTYNANGGSGAPGSQTKWKDQTLALSTVKPTKTGHSFLGWSTSSTATSATYAAGANYTSNTAVTLYAVWKANTYVVKYNANGGTGAPGNQTKTYGKSLTLSTVKPTRTNYIFKGWSTSASSTTVAYASGATYTNNAAATLYAVWELGYFKPRISNVSISRCDSNGAASDEGRNAAISFAWETDKTVSSISIQWKPSSGTTWSNTTVAASGTSGTVNTVFGSNSLSTETTYDIRVSVSDSGGSSYANTTLVSIHVVFDVLSGGKGISFGKTAELEDVAEFEYAAKFNGDVYGNAVGMNRLPEILANSDFNNYLKPGCYGVYTDANSETIANIPVNRAGRLEVWSSTADGNPGEHLLYLRQRYIPYTLSNPTWERDIRRSKEDVWEFGKWFRTSLSRGGQKMLWGSEYDNGWYMRDDHTFELADSVAEQPNGIVLVFCYYGGASDTNKNYKSFFIPKYMVGSTATEHTFTLSESLFTYVGTKRLYINNTTISGHADNTATGTKNGITYANNKFVLRYVIGV